MGLWYLSIRTCSVLLLVLLSLRLMDLLVLILWCLCLNPKLALLIVCLICSGQLRRLFLAPVLQLIPSFDGVFGCHLRGFLHRRHQIVHLQLSHTETTRFIRFKAPGFVHAGLLSIVMGILKGVVEISITRY